MKSINDKVCDLMEMMEPLQFDDDDNIIFSQQAKDLIHEITLMIGETKQSDNLAESRRAYAEGTSAGLIYYDMLYKIVHAPTKLHMNCTVRWLIPLIDEKLRNE